MSREEMLELLWSNAILFPADAVNRVAKDDAEIGPVLAKMLQSGVTAEEISKLLSWSNYEAVFSTLYELEASECDDLDALHEDLLSSRPEEEA